MTASNTARGLVISLAALLLASTVTMASQTYVLRSGAPRWKEPTRFQAGIDHRSPTTIARNPWLIDDRYEIDDPDAAGSSDVPGRAGTDKAVQIARKYRGTRYVWGGTTSRGFDCSGFVRYVYARLGHSLPRTASEQFRVGQRVPFAQLQPGDILFFHTSRRGVSHVGIYVGDNKFIHAANPRKGVTISSLAGYYAHRLVGARRVA
ncbi:MAG: C40 family peptidase [Chloroflexi bacterium]|nr:C40 family peptidase [Chloroflexota bacterium]